MIKRHRYQQKITRYTKTQRSTGLSQKKEINRKYPNEVQILDVPDKD